MITIDFDQCIGCFKCVTACPFHVLTAEGKKPAVNKDGLCIKCLHCAAVCPQNAICYGDVEGILPRELPVFPENLPGLIEDFLMTRRSYRHFKPSPVPRDLLEKVLRVSAWAPSAKNQHPTKWIVINDENLMKSIMQHILDHVRETGVSPEIAEIYDHGQNVVMGNAKTLLMGYARTNAINPPVDTALALHNIDLMLQSQGLGCCWAGYLTRLSNQIPAIRELLKLPEGYQFYGSLMIGFPVEEEYIHIPNRIKQPDIQWFE